MEVGSDESDSDSLKSGEFKYLKVSFHSDGAMVVSVRDYSSEDDAGTASDDFDRSSDECSGSNEKSCEDAENISGGTAKCSHEAGDHFNESREDILTSIGDLSDGVRGANDGNEDSDTSSEENFFEASDEVHKKSDDSDDYLSDEADDVTVGNGGHDLVDRAATAEYGDMVNVSVVTANDSGGDGNTDQDDMPLFGDNYGSIDRVRPGVGDMKAASKTSSLDSGYIPGAARSISASHATSSSIKQVDYSTHGCDISQSHSPANAHNVVLKTDAATPLPLENPRSEHEREADDDAEAVVCVVTTSESDDNECGYCDLFGDSDEHHHHYLHRAHHSDATTSDHGSDVTADVMCSDSIVLEERDYSAPDDDSSFVDVVSTDNSDPGDNASDSGDIGDTNHNDDGDISDDDDLSDNGDISSDLGDDVDDDDVGCEGLCELEDSSSCEGEFFNDDDMFSRRLWVIPEEDEVSEEALQLEQTELTSSVEQVRESAVHLMSCSDKYSKLVEPELNSLNQRWQQVSTTLKEKSAVLQDTLSSASKANEVKVTPAITTSLAASSLSGVNAEEQLNKTLSSVDLFLSNCPDEEPESQRSSEEVRRLGEDVRLSLVEGERRAREVEKIQPEESQRIHASIKKLQICWQTVEAKVNKQRQVELVASPEWTQYQQDIHHLESWLSDIETKVMEAEGDSEKLKTLQRDTEEQQDHFDSQISRGDELSRQEGTEEIAQSVSQLSMRWHNLNTHFSQLPQSQSTEILQCIDDDTDASIATQSQTVSVVTSASELQEAATISNTEVIVTEDATTSIISKDQFSEVPADFIDMVGQLLIRVQDTGGELKTAALSARQYEDFSGQEDNLKYIKEALEELQPSVQAAETFQEPALSNASPEDCVRIGDLMGCLRLEWADANSLYTELYGQWSSSVERWGQFHCDLKEVNSWLGEAEVKLTLSHQPGSTLDDSRIRHIQKELEAAVKSRQATVTNINCLGG